MKTPPFPIAFGDLQGCLRPFQDLLNQIQPSAETPLWFCGDLINRGSQSLETLQTIYQLRAPKKVVMGNHDLHLIAVAAGIRQPHPQDTLTEIIQSKQAAELLNWLRKQPFVHFENQHLLVHAGVHPFWDLTRTLELADELHQALNQANWQSTLKQLFEKGNVQWQPNLPKIDRMAASLNVFTRIRFCTAQGVLNFLDKGPPGKHTDMAWFDHPERQTKNIKIVFGHWSALGLKITDQIIALDSGCVWGKQLSAVRLNTTIQANDIFQVSCAASNTISPFKIV